MTTITIDSPESAEAAAAVFARPAPRGIEKREMLWSGGVISIKIPKVCKETHVDDLHYIGFPRLVTGGFVNIYVHADKPGDYCGRTIHAEIEVHSKTFVGGDSFFHVDLRPTDKVVTHRLIVEEKTKDFGEVGKVRFELPSPLKGAIVITAPKVPKERTEKPVDDTTPPVVQVRTSTGDGQLDRYLADGWKIASETPTAVHLAKGERTLLHNKPKKKR